MCGLCVCVCALFPGMYIRRISLCNRLGWSVPWARMCVCVCVWGVCVCVCAVFPGCMLGESLYITG